MGPPACEEVENSHGYESQPLAALPTPASVHDTLDTPILESPLRVTHERCQPLPARDGLWDAVHVLPTQPGDVHAEAVVTPLADEMPVPDMNLLVGGALAPTHSAPPPRASPKRSRPGLRLPSFHVLGIANPNPDRFGFDGSLTYGVADAKQRPIDTPYDEYGFTPMFPAITIPGGRTIQSPVHQLVNTLTPPADSEHTNWSSMLAVTSAMDSPAADSGNIVPAEGRRQSAAAASGLPSHISTRDTAPDDRPSWIRGAMDVIVDNLRRRSVHTDSLRIMSHALPSPSPTGHIFSEVLGAISTSTPGSASSPMTWINVFHAIPGKFNLQDLPRSPPTTPGPAIGGEDYFTEKVFDSAVSVADYQQDLALPRSPCPVVPPNSIDVSIVERYIPPSTTNEFSTMFDPNGASILIDRLIELSPHNGDLLFIYPTRAGAETFMREYLGPILDPILRSLAVVESFPADLNKALGSMIAADQLPDYETMHHRMATLCARLTQRSSAAERFHGRRPHLTLSYASKQYVHLSRDAWARDWWCKQERTRLREAITRHSQEAQKIPRKDYGAERRSPAEILQELLSNLEKKSYDPGKEPTHGVEVSVFVITRSS